LTPSRLVYACSGLLRLFYAPNLIFSPPPTISPVPSGSKRTLLFLTAMFRAISFPLFPLRALFPSDLHFPFLQPTYCRFQTSLSFSSRGICPPPLSSVFLFLSFTESLPSVCCLLSIFLRLLLFPQEEYRILFPMSCTCAIQFSPLPPPYFLRSAGPLWPHFSGTAYASPEGNLLPFPNWYWVHSFLFSDEVCLASFLFLVPQPTPTPIV